MQSADPVLELDSTSDKSFTECFAIVSAKDERCRRLDATAKSSENQIRRANEYYQDTLYNLEQKAGRTTTWAAKARECSEEESAQFNALYRLRENGRKVSRKYPNKNAPQIKLYKFVLRTWSSGGKPVAGVPIYFERIEKVLKCCTRTAKCYVADIREHLQMEKGGRSHPARYRPNISQEDVLLLRMRTVNRGTT